MKNQKSMFISALSLTLCLALITGCGSQATAIPTATFIPSPTIIPLTVTPSPTETLTPVYLTSSNNPPAQGYINMAYDSESEKVILMNAQQNMRMLDPGTWVFDTVTKAWEEHSGLFTGEGPMAYDSQSDRIIVFLGLGGAGSVDQLVGIRKTLAYDYNTDTWTDMNPVESPIAFIGARMAYDSESDKVIMLAAVYTWVYDFETNTWTDMQPTGDLPPGSNYQAMSYDTNADRVIAWQCEITSPKCRIGAYDYNSNTWETRETEIGPTARDYTTMVYDPKTGLNILFGGQSLTGYMDETWGYDYESNTWTLIPTINPPSARGWHAMAYDEKTGLIILFGGGKSRSKFTDETWAYDPVKNEWALYQLPK